MQKLKRQVPLIDEIESKIDKATCDLKDTLTRGIPTFLFICVLVYSL
ncbi:hypothetical protein RDI58_000834 [Solanum bulbocastanum]|uniref:Uncharacterized protein n=1 Tax=Solanum bulbocastanum TaxID=147425 RepID=A0AAN8UBE4_SOLBU